MHVCNWLPGLVPCSNWAEFEEYEKILYSIFSNDFIQTRPLYENKDVVIRKYPLRNGHEEAFYHLTSKEYRSDMERQPDPKRCERIRWIRAFIENYQCDSSLCEEFEGIKTWEEPYKMYRRVFILSEYEKYVVVLEKRDTYILLVTAYYLDYPHSLRKLLARYVSSIK